MIESNQSLGDGLTDSIDLGDMTTTVNTDTDIYTSKLFLKNTNKKKSIRHIHIFTNNKFIGAIIFSVRHKILFIGKINFGISNNHHENVTGIFYASPQRFLPCQATTKVLAICIAKLWVQFVPKDGH